MPSSLSPLLGYNTNVRHGGKVFHVQTEDSGVRYGHVITHLFVDGGRILKSFKSSYAEHVGTEQQNDVVRSLMKRQHKAMLLALRDGRFDALAEILPSRTGTSKPQTEGPPAGSERQPSHRRSPRPTADKLPRPVMAAAPHGSTPRHAVPSRPASAFGHAKPQQGKSIFGDDATADKSLDDVILSYLATDSDPDGKGR